MILLSGIVKDIEILYEDNFIIIVNKPAGLSVQGGKGIKSSLDKILTQMKISGNNPDAPPLLVHRLDKDTSGILLAAKGKKAAARFSRLLNQKAVKQYIAVCAGHPETKEGTITHDLYIRGKKKNSKTGYSVIKKGRFPFSTPDNNPPSDIIENVLGSMPENALLSALENVLGTIPSYIDFSVMELELNTGRMHQIRRHLALIGNPVIGDDKYGDFSLNKKLKKSGVKRLLLHSSRLIINDGEINIDVNAPLPEHFHPFT